MNADGTYGILDLATHFTQYPDCKDTTVLQTGTHKYVDHNAFKDLFSQYQITGVDTKLTPNFSQNMAGTVFNSGSSNNRVPNYEIFIIPATKQTHYRAELASMLRIELDAFLNVTKAVAKRMIPSRTQMYKCRYPKVVSFDTAIDKASNLALTEMTRPPWLRTYDPNPNVDARETHVKHYSNKLLIRRVDGRPLIENHNGATLNHNELDFRIDQTIYFKCRTTPRDVLEKVSLTANV